MTETALNEEDALEGEDSFEDVDGLEEDGFEELEELDAVDVGEDGLDELEAAEELGDEFEDALAEEEGEEGEEEDAFEEFGDFALDESSGLFVPARPALITGPAATAVASRLNPFVLESMNADDADAFFRRIGRAVRGAVRRVGGVVSRVGRIAGPLLRRALPMIQRVAGLAGPWGRVISAGIGAARGLMAGRGLRGALAGAVGGLIPGVGGRIASSILGADGADDDAALDALADMADARQVSPGVALPLAAGLATRVATPRVAGAVPPGLALPARAAERAMLQAGLAAGGRAGRMVRTMRLIARLARAALRRRAPLAVTGPLVRPAAVARTAQAMPGAVRTAARRVVPWMRRRPGVGAASPAMARRRLAMRRRILGRVPIGALRPRFVAGVA
jgi:hypothetical protein